MLILTKVYSLTTPLLKNPGKDTIFLGSKQFIQQNLKINWHKISAQTQKI